MDMSYKPINPFEENKENKRHQNLLKRAETNPHVQKQLEDNSEKEMIPSAIKWIKNRKQEKKFMIP